MSRSLTAFRVLLCLSPPQYSTTRWTLPLLEAAWTPPDARLRAYERGDRGAQASREVQGMRPRRAPPVRAARRAVASTRPSAVAAIARGWRPHGVLATLAWRARAWALSMWSGVSVTSACECIACEVRADGARRGRRARRARSYPGRLTVMRLSCKVSYDVRAMYSSVLGHACAARSRWSVTNASE